MLSPTEEIWRNCAGR